jgi:hypothetical protein
MQFLTGKGRHLLPTFLSNEPGTGQRENFKIINLQMHVKNFLKVVPEKRKKNLTSPSVQKKKTAF